MTAAERSQIWHKNMYSYAFVSALMAHYLVEKYNISEEEMQEVLKKNLDAHEHSSYFEDMKNYCNLEKLSISVMKCGYNIFEYDKIVEEKKRIKAENEARAVKRMVEARRLKEERKREAMERHLANLEKNKNKKKNKGKSVPKPAPVAPVTPVVPQKKKLVVVRKKVSE